MDPNHYCRSVFQLRAKVKHIRNQFVRIKYQDILIDTVYLSNKRNRVIVSFAWNPLPIFTENCQWNASLLKKIHILYTCRRDKALGELSCLSSSTLMQKKRKRMLQDHVLINYRIAQFLTRFTSPELIQILVVRNCCSTCQGTLVVFCYANVQDTEDYSIVLDVYLNTDREIANHPMVYSLSENIIKLARWGFFWTFGWKWLSLKSIDWALFEVCWT